MSSVTELTRMSGMMSGLDTESLVKAATASTKNAINTKKQKLQTLQWKQDAYRDIITTMSNFQNKYLDIISKTSIRSNAVMNAHKAESSNSSLSVAASSSAVDTKYTISSVQTAKAAKVEGSTAAAGSVELDFSKAAEGKNTVKVTLDGTTKNITFNGGENAKDNFLTALNDSFSDISAAKFSFKDGTNKLAVQNEAGDNVTHIFTVGYSDSVGLKNDASNRISTSATLGSIDFAQELSGDEYKFSINGVDFSFNKDTTIKDMMSTVNKSSAGVKMSFNTLAQSFTLETTETGAGKKIDISQKSGNLVNALFNMGADQVGTEPSSQQLFSVATHNDVKFNMTASKNGFTKDDSITVNGKKLDLSGLKQTQEKEKITVEGKEIDAEKYTDASGDIYKFKTSDGTVHYAQKNGDKFDDVMSVADKKVYGADGNEIEGKTESEQLEEMGIEKKMKEYSADEMAEALNKAYKASFKDEGSFSVEYDDGSDEAKITFTPAAGNSTSIEGAGSVSVEDTGYTDQNGAASNYTRTPFSETAELSLESSITFKANGTDVTVTGSGANGLVTIKDLTDTGYFAYDQSTGNLSVVGKNQIDAGSSEALKDIFGSTMLSGDGYSGAFSVHGSNATATINGVTLESATNSFIVDGTTFGIENVKEFTAADVENGTAEAITVDVSKDNSKIKETILNFVEDYNKLLDTINTQLTTERPKSSGSYYDPLTEEQEEEMEQDEIDKWNEKAKQGMLYRDSTLTRVFTNLRSAINASVGGMTIQALGIDTSNDYADYGKLKIADESVLDSAIERYGDKISEFFTDTQKGLGASLNNAVKSAIDTSVSKNGYPKGLLTGVAGVANTRSAKKNLLYTQLESVQSIIDKLNKRYESEQDRYWKQYSSLETYIANMNNQSATLFGTQQMG